MFKETSFTKEELLFLLDSVVKKSIDFKKSQMPTSHEDKELSVKCIDKIVSLLSTTSYCGGNQ